MFQYIKHIVGLIEKAAGQQEDKIQTLAERIAKSIGAGGVLHAFGTGHSHMLCEELFHRSGGLVPVNAIVDINLTQWGSVNPSLLERMPGYAKLILAAHDLRAGEVLLVISNSGINPVTVEVAQEAKERGLFVAALTSAEAYRDVPSRHPSGLKLSDVAELVIDTGVPKGDGVVEVDPKLPKVGPASTVVTAALINAVLVETVNRLVAAGFEPPIFISGNVGGDEHNDVLMKRYADRIPVYYKIMTTRKPSRGG